jgi:hypothetical protein
MIPNIFIIGAQKAATSSIASILNQHDEIIFIKEELNYISRSDYSCHQGYFHDLNEGLLKPKNYSRNKQIIQYEELIKPMYEKNKLIGEHSTMYLPSELTPSRLRDLNSSPKLIVCLRNPIDRLISHYHHLVALNKTIFDLKMSLKISSEPLINNGHYKKQIQNWFKYFDSSSFHFIIFEDFIRDPIKIINGTIEFLNLKIDNNIFNKKSNKTLYPSSQLLSFFNNYLSIKYGKKSINRLINKINLRGSKKSKILDKNTYEYLNLYYKEVNHGLDELINKNTNWY